MFKRILIVDGSLLSRIVIKQHLETAGCRGADFEEAGDGASALAVVRERSVDLIVVEIDLPLMDGYELLSKLRASERSRRIPVIVISADDGGESQERFAQLGVGCVIGKPVSENLFRGALAKIAEKEKIEG